MSITAKAAIWFVICNVFQKGIAVITVPIFTRLMTTAEYGVYSLYMSWFNIFTIITSLNLYYGVFNNALNKINDKNERNKYVSSMQGIVVTLTLVLSTVYLLFQNFFSKALGLKKPIIVLMLIELLVEPSLHFWQARQRFEYRYKIMVGVTMLKSLINPLLGLLLVVIFPDDRATARVFSIVITEVIFAGAVMCIQFIKGKTFFHKEYWKYALSFNIVLIPHYLSGTILNQGDRIMIQKMVGESEVGIYSVAYSIGMLIQLFTNAIIGSLTPWFYDNLNRKNYKDIRKIIDYILIFLAIIVVCVCFFVPEAVRIFGAETYYNARYVVPPIAASVFFIFLLNVFSIPQMYFEKQMFMPIASILSALINIFLNFIFIPFSGYYAAGYTTLASYILYSVGHYYFSKKICIESVGTFEMFDRKNIFIISICVVLCSIVFIFLYNFSWIRYLSALVLVCFVYYNRKNIFAVIEQIRKKNREGSAQ